MASSRSLLLIGASCCLAAVSASISAHAASFGGSAAAQSATSTTAKPQKQEQLSKEAHKLLAAKQPNAVWLCVVSGTTTLSTANETLVKAIAKVCAASLGSHVTLVFCGAGGVQPLFAPYFTDPTRVMRLMPEGQSSICNGMDVYAGRSLAERKEIFSHIGDVYLTIEGGAALCQIASAAARRGVPVVPVIRTGGASSGMFEFPRECLQPPLIGCARYWPPLQLVDAPTKECAKAVGNIMRILTAPAPIRKDETDVIASHAVVAEALQSTRPKRRNKRRERTAVPGDSNVQNSVDLRAPSQQAAEDISAQSEVIEKAQAHRAHEDEAAGRASGKETAQWETLEEVEGYLVQEGDAFAEEAGDPTAQSEAAEEIEERRLQHEEAAVTAFDHMGEHMQVVEQAGECRFREKAAAAVQELGASNASAGKAEVQPMSSQVKGPRAANCSGAQTKDAKHVEQEDAKLAKESIAATVIQSRFRGSKARAQMKAMSVVAIMPDTDGFDDVKAELNDYTDGQHVADDLPREITMSVDYVVENVNYDGLSKTQRKNIKRAVRKQVAKIAGLSRDADPKRVIDVVLSKPSLRVHIFLKVDPSGSAADLQVGLTNSMGKLLGREIVTAINATPRIHSVLDGDATVREPLVHQRESVPAGEFINIEIAADTKQNLGWVPTDFPPSRVFVASVKPGSWADRHCLEPDDELLSVDGKSMPDIASGKQLTELLQRRPVLLQLFRYTADENAEEQLRLDEERQRSTQESFEARLHGYQFRCRELEDAFRDSQDTLSTRNAELSQLQEQMRLLRQQLQTSQTNLACSQERELRLLKQVERAQHEKNRSDQERIEIEQRLNKLLEEKEQNAEDIEDEDGESESLEKLVAELASLLTPEMNVDLKIIRSAVEKCAGDRAAAFDAIVNKLSCTSSSSLG